MSMQSIVRSTLLLVFVVAGAATAQQDAVMKARQTSRVSHASVAMRHVGGRVAARPVSTTRAAEATSRKAAARHVVLGARVHFRS